MSRAGLNRIGQIGIALVAFAAMVGLAPAAFAEPAADDVSEATSGGEFVRKQKSIRGDWHIEQRGDTHVLVFGDSFKASRGPDLKVFLSPQSIGEASGKTAVRGSLLLGELESTRGGQEYVIPAGVNLDDYGSVLVHCEAYSVLWGGGDL